MSLLIENIDTNLTKIVTKVTDDNEKKYYIEGIFIQCDVVNQNNRIYPSSVVDYYVNKHYMRLVEGNRAVGELEHPEDGRDNSINLRYVSHKIEKLWKDNNDWYGRAVITRGTPMGATVCGLLSEGITLGTSSRCDGAVMKSGGVNVVQSQGFKIIAASDIVHDPSAPDAFVTALMEKRQWVYDGTSLTECVIDEVTANVNKLTRIDKLDDDALRKIYDGIMKSLA